MRIGGAQLSSKDRHITEAKGILSCQFKIPDIQVPFNPVVEKGGSDCFPGEEVTVQKNLGQRSQRARGKSGPDNSKS